MAAVDLSVVSVVLPALQEDLHIPTSFTQWVVLAYLLPLIALTLPCGRWVDRIGKRAALTFSATGFAAASAAAGAASGVGWLMGARVAQGAFGALLTILSLALTTNAVHPRMRGRAMGGIATLGSLGAVSGPPIGGVLLETLGWPWIFYLNIPICLVIVIIGRAQLAADGPLRLPNRTWIAESALLVCATMAFLCGLSLTASHGPGWLAIVFAAIPPLMAWRRMGTSQTVRHLVSSPAMAAPHMALLVTAAAVGFVFFLTPFYLQQQLHVSAAVTGLTIAAFPIGGAVFGPIGGVLADRWNPRSVACIGAAVLMSGLLLTTPLSLAWTPAELAWRLAVIGAGVGLSIGPNMAMTMSLAPQHLLGVAGASTTLARQVGFAFGPALATVVWALSGYTVGGMRSAILLAAGVSALGLISITAVQLPWCRGPLRKEWPDDHRDEFRRDSPACTRRLGPGGSS